MVAINLPKICIKIQALLIDVMRVTHFDSEAHTVHNTQSNCEYAVFTCQFAWLGQYSRLFL